MTIAGIAGQPYIDLESEIDLVALRELHREICTGLARAEVTYTGGFHAITGRDLPGENPTHQDYGIVLQNMTPADRAAYIALRPGVPASATIEELLALVPTTSQKKFLKMAFGVYFPWQTYLQLRPAYWEASDTEASTAELAQLFPTTLAFVERLPFEEIRKVDLLGVDPYHHVIVHRDYTDAAEPEQSINLCPLGNKRLYLYDPDTKARIPMRARALVFNNRDFHGVDAHPFFTYSLRVQGRFTPTLRRRFGLA